MPGIASAATAVVIGHVAAGTTRIRVGAGGIMLPNHAPLVIAEQFGTLDALFPGRIDLGIGRAPGTDPLTLGLCGATLPRTSMSFPRTSSSSCITSAPPNRVRRCARAGRRTVDAVLDSRLESIRRESRGGSGLPFAFASHFAPGQLSQALQLYRGRFRPPPRSPSLM